MKHDSHIFIAEKAIEELKGHNIEINKRLFLIGSVIPDYSPRHKVIRHYYDSSIEYIESLMEFVVKSTNYHKVSLYLGVITHYLTDYFTSPHFNNITLTSKAGIKHLQYEIGLDNFIKSNKIIEVDVKHYEFKDIRTMINREMEGYNNNYSFVSDIKFAIEAITSMFLSINGWGLAI